MFDIATFVKLLIDFLVKILPEVIKILFFGNKEKRKSLNGKQEREIRASEEERALSFLDEPIESHKSEILIKKGEYEVHIPESIEVNKLRTLMKELGGLL
jgi:hypothetical protein